MSRLKSLLQRIFPLFLAITLLPTSASAYVGLCCGYCGGNMPLNIPGGGIPMTNEFRVKISPSYMNMKGLRDGTNALDIDSILGMPVMMGNPTGLYMAAPVSMDMSMMNLSIGYSFSPEFFGGIMFMAHEKSMEMKFNSMMRGMTGQETFSMKSKGLGDTMLMTKYRLYANDPMIPTSQVSLFGGLSLPTGSISERNGTHPVASRQSELLPYGMQLGSGTFDPTVGLLYQGSASPFWWGINMTYTPRFYKNSKNYNLGEEFNLDLYGLYQFRYDALVHVQLNGSKTGRIKGEMREAVLGTAGRATQGDPNSPYMTPLWDPSNSGGTQLDLTVGVQWQPIPMHILDIQVGAPLSSDKNGIQLKDNYRIMATWYIEIPTSKSKRHPDYKAPAGASKLGF